MSGHLARSPALRKPVRFREPDALTAREVDGLISKLLGEIKIPFSSLGRRVLGHIADLKKILSTDYLEDASLPSKDLLKELSGIVETQIKGRASKFISQAGPDTPIWRQWEDPELLSVLANLFGGRKIEIRAQPYLEGAGLALRGFFCRASVGAENKFVIFVNTAHHPGAVVATFGHEIGHYIYGSLVGEKAPMAAFLEGTFSNHLAEEDELFADSLVAFSAYDRELIRQIGVFHRVMPGKAEELSARIRKAYGLIAPRFNLDLSRNKMSSVWRVRYLTSMTHFFKLRCALLQTTGL
jgi:hypothetical protein